MLCTRPQARVGYARHGGSQPHHPGMKRVCWQMDGWHLRSDNSRAQLTSLLCHLETFLRESCDEFPFSLLFVALFTRCVFFSVLKRKCLLGTVSNVGFFPILGSSVTGKSPVVQESEYSDTEPSWIILLMPTKQLASLNKPSSDCIYEMLCLPSNKPTLFKQ